MKYKAQNGWRITNVCKTFNSKIACIIIILIDSFVQYPTDNNNNNNYQMQFEFGTQDANGSEKNSRDLLLTGVGIFSFSKFGTDENHTGNEWFQAIK